MRNAFVAACVGVYVAGLGVALHFPETRAALLAPFRLLWSLL